MTLAADEELKRWVRTQNSVVCIIEFFIVNETLGNIMRVSMQDQRRENPFQVRGNQFIYYSLIDSHLFAPEKRSKIEACILIINEAAAEKCSNRGYQPQKPQRLDSPEIVI
jgi:hypothetical protein